MINFVLATVYCWIVATHNNSFVHWKPRLLMYATWHTFQGWHQKASWNSENHSTHQAYPPFSLAASGNTALPLMPYNSLKKTLLKKNKLVLSVSSSGIINGKSPEKTSCVYQKESDQKENRKHQPSLYFFQISFPWESNIAPVSMKQGAPTT